MLAANATDIGNIVRRRRTKAALSQGELADKIGVSRKWIADLEKGHPRAQLHLVLDVLNALDALVDVIDAPGAQPTVGTPAYAATDLTPRIAVPAEVTHSLERAVNDARLSPAARRAIETVRQLNTVDPQQFSAIRNALVHVKLDEDTLNAIRRASKELTRAEANWPGKPRSLGSRDNHGDDAS
ncbi:helix-turn-helix domain-containing protein [Demequina sp. TTPB684]|uniref:helix-turn-helix domain-containing protein n=1 Tax=unclassified Demequina TaxID=2620311 RepID=UPI001CF577FA|nr:MULTISPECIES: helix-turn-helix domain-containing protein [unclassified Demequina]MCB2413936.1 helix-turn-helix domain-containing protein [Demequina sp. TTPB684]UPU88709.1 helix-turn-helix domain-containing protein [Demequina sp. TMPB413]